jgi:hypothetical protein
MHVIKKLSLGGKRDAILLANTNITSIISAVSQPVHSAFCQEPRNTHLKHSSHRRFRRLR